MRKIFGCIDIGSDAIKLIVGEVFDGKINVLAALSEETKGYLDHEIVDEQALMTVIKRLLERASEKLGFKIKKLIANIPTSENRFIISEVTNTITNEEYSVTGDDILRIMQSAAYNQISDKEELVAVLPINFRTDDEETKEPYGKKCKKLSLKAVLVKAPKFEIYEMVRVLEKCEVDVIDITTTGLVDYFNFKNEQNDNKTGVIINIGAYKTSLSIFSKGIYVNNEIIDTGGVYIDRDISLIYNLNKKDAKFLKENYALANIRRSNPKESVRIVNKTNEELEINQYELTEIVSSRVEDILKLSKKSLNLLTKKEISYIIVTGGLTELRDFPLALTSVFGDAAKIGNISTIGVRHNKYSVALGMIKYFNGKLELRNRQYSTVSEAEAAAMVSDEVKPSGDTILGKVFGYFFDN